MPSAALPEDFWCTWAECRLQGQSLFASTQYPACRDSVPLIMHNTPDGGGIRPFVVGQSGPAVLPGWSVWSALGSLLNRAAASDGRGPAVQGCCVVSPERTPTAGSAGLTTSVRLPKCWALLQRAAASGGGGSRTMGHVSHFAVSLVAMWRWCLGQEERALYKADSEVRHSTHLTRATSASGGIRPPEAGCCLKQTASEASSCRLGQKGGALHGRVEAAPKGVLSSLKVLLSLLPESCSVYQAGSRKYAAALRACCSLLRWASGRHQ